MTKKNIWQEVKEKHWPGAKKELEKGIDNAKDMLSAGEKHIRSLSEKSAAKAKKISLQVKKERLTYQLGKSIASTAKNKWGTSKKIQELRDQVKDLEKEIRKIK